MIIVVAIPPDAVITAGKSRQTRQGGRGRSGHGRQTHFTCVEKINAKRLKKQLPHKLRSAQFGVQLQIGGSPERGEGRGAGGAGCGA